MAEIDRTAARCISMLCVLISPFYKSIKIGRSKTKMMFCNCIRFSAIIADPYVEEIEFSEAKAKEYKFYHLNLYRI